MDSHEIYPQNDQTIGNEPSLGTATIDSKGSHYKLKYCNKSNLNYLNRIAEAYTKFKNSSRDINDIIKKLKSIAERTQNSRIATLENENQEISSLITIIQDRPGESYKMLHSFNQEEDFDPEREKKFIKEVILSLENNNPINLVIKDGNPKLLEFYKNIGFEVSNKQSNEKGDRYLTLNLDLSRLINEESEIGDNWIKTYISEYIENKEFLFENLDFEDSLQNQEEIYRWKNFKETKIYKQLSTLTKNEQEKFEIKLFEIFLIKIAQLVPHEMLKNADFESIKGAFYNFISNIKFNNSYENPNDFIEIFEEYLETLIYNEYEFSTDISFIYNIKNKAARKKLIETIGKSHNKSKEFIEMLSTYEIENLTRDNVLVNLQEFFKEFNDENSYIYVKILRNCIFFEEIFNENPEYFKKFLKNIDTISKHPWGLELLIKHDDTYSQEKSGTSIYGNNQTFENFKFVLENVSILCQEIDNIKSQLSKDENKQKYKIDNINGFEASLQKILEYYKFDFNFEPAEFERIINNLRNKEYKTYITISKNEIGTTEPELTKDDFIFILEAITGEGSIGFLTSPNYKMIEKYFQLSKRDISLKDYLDSTQKLFGNLNLEIPNLYNQEEVFFYINPYFLSQIQEIKKNRPEVSDNLIFYILSLHKSKEILGDNITSLSSEEIYSKLINDFEINFEKTSQYSLNTLAVSIFRLKEILSNDKNLNDKIKNKFLEQIKKLTYPVVEETNDVNGERYHFSNRFTDNKIFEIFPDLPKIEKPSEEQQTIINLLAFEFAKGKFNQKEIKYLLGLFFSENPSENETFNFTQDEIKNIFERLNENLKFIPLKIKIKFLSLYSAEYQEKDPQEFSYQIFNLLEANYKEIDKEDLLAIARMLPIEFLNKSILNDFLALDKMPGPTDRKEKAQVEILKFLKEKYFYNREYFDEDGFFDFSTELQNIPRDLRLLLYIRQRGTNYLKFYSRFFAVEKKFSFKDSNIIRQYLVYIEDSPPKVKDLFNTINRVIYKIKDLNKKDISQITNIYGSLPLFNTLLSIPSFEFNKYFDLNKISKMSLEEIYNYILELKEKLPKIIFTDEINIDSLNYMEEIVPGTTGVLQTYSVSQPNIDRDYLTRIINSFNSITGIKGWRDFKYRNIISGEFFKFLTTRQQEVWASNISYDDIEPLREKFKNHPQRIHNFFMEAFKNYEPIGPLTTDELEIHNFILTLLRDSPEFGSDDYYEFLTNKLDDIQKPLNIALDRKNLLDYLEFNLNKFSRGNNINLNSFDYDLKILSSYLTSDEIEIITENYKNTKIKGLKICNSEDLIPDNIYIKLQEKFENNKNIYTEAIYKINNTYNLELTTNSKDLFKVLNEIRNKPSVKIRSQILKILSANSLDIAKNKLGENSNDDLTQVVKSLNEYFQFTGFNELFQNIRTEISNREFESSELIYIFSDSPLLISVCGECPQGSNSCQNYTNGSQREKLASYIGDSHNKVAYAIDKSKLTPEQIKIILTKGPNSPEFNLIEKEILPAIVARSIIKLGRSSSNNPSIIMEPVYTNQNKSNHTYDAGFIRFLNSMFTTEDGFNVYAPHQETNGATLPISENKYGTYEDRTVLSGSGTGIGAEYSLR